MSNFNSLIVFTFLSVEFTSMPYRTEAVKMSLVMSLEQ